MAAANTEILARRSHDEPRPMIGPFPQKFFHHRRSYRTCSGRYSLARYSAWRKRIA